MSDLHRARARAEAFARAIDDGPRHSARHSSSRPSDDPELDSAVDLVRRLRDAGAVTPRPEFTAELRHRLLEQAAARAATTPTVIHGTADRSVAGTSADTLPDLTMPNGTLPDGMRSDGTLPEDEESPPDDADGATVTKLAPRRGRRIRLVAGTAALVLLGGGIGSAAVAQQAMPGDTLYGVKRSIENVSTNVGVGDDSRGRRELEHAMTRLTEVRKLASEGADPTTINTTLGDFVAQARRGVSLLVGSYQQDPDPASITTVTTFLTGAGRGISELAPLLPPESLKSAVEALATIEQLARQVTAACPDCAKPTPAVGRPGDTNPSSEPTNELSMVPPPTIPSPGTSTGPSTSSEPSGKPTPSGQPSNSPQSPTSSGTPSGTPTGPGTVSPSLPTLPTVPTPSTPNWPWPLPTLSLPPLLPSLNVPGVLQTLLPPPR